MLWLWLEKQRAFDQRVFYVVRPVVTFYPFSRRRVKVHVAVLFLVPLMLVRGFTRHEAWQARLE
jgi:hypothetical protein